MQLVQRDWSRVIFHHEAVPAARSAAGSCSGAHTATVKPPASSDGWWKVLSWSCQSSSTRDSRGEKAENVSGLRTPPGAPSHVFWPSGAVMAVCGCPASCRQPGAHQTAETTFLLDVASSRATTLREGLCVLAERGDADCGRRKQDIIWFSRLSGPAVVTLRLHFY